MMIIERLEEFFVWLGRLRRSWLGMTLAEKQLAALQEESRENRRQRERLFAERCRAVDQKDAEAEAKRLREVRLRGVSEEEQRAASSAWAV